MGKLRDFVNTLWFNRGTTRADVMEFESNINNLDAYQEIHIDRDVTYYCVQMEGFVVKGNGKTANGKTLYGATMIPADSLYYVTDNECVVVGPAGDTVVMSRGLLCSLFVREDGSTIDAGGLRREYDWFKVKLSAKQVAPLSVLAIPKGYVLNTCGLHTNGGYGKKGHGSCDYIVCANNDINKRYIVNGVILGLESAEGMELQPNVEAYISSMDDIKSKIEVG